MADERKAEQEVREHYVITEESMEAVNTYVPIRIKTDLVDLIADKCILKSEMTAEIDGQEMSMPPMYTENTNAKSRYLMGVLVRLYLCGGFKPESEDDIWIMPEEEYDKWAGGHVFNQLERFKQNPKYKNVCFDLLSDYRDFEKRLNIELYGKINSLNDPVARQLAAIQASTSPDSVEGILEQLKELQETKEVGE